MTREPFVLIAFADGRAEAYEHADADVFRDGTLTITCAERVLFEVASGVWLYATAYDRHGWPLYTHKSKEHAEVDPKRRARTTDEAEAIINELLREHIARTLRTFYEAPLSVSSLQPVLDLAVDLNPGLKVRS